MEILQSITWMKLLSLWVIGFFEFAIATMFFRNFFHYKPGTGRVKVALIIVLFATLIMWVNYFQHPLFNTVSVVTIYYLITTTLFESSWPEKIKFCIMFGTISTGTELGMTICMPMIIRLNEFHSLKMDTMFFMALVSKVVLFLVVLMVLRLFPKKYYVEYGNNSLWLLIFPVLGIIGMYFLLYLRQKDVEYIAITAAAFGVLLPLSALAPLLVYNSTLEKNKLENQLRLAEIQRQANDVFYQAQERNLYESRIRIHDFKNHLVNLHALCTPSKEGEAYFNSLMDSLNAQAEKFPLEIDNKVVSVIIGRVRSFCRQNEIHFDLEINCGGLGFLDLLDASAIFDNALDNAIQACMEIEDRSKRRIKLSIQEHKYFVLVSVVNSKQNKIIPCEGGLKSTKQDAASHGLGIKNIRIAAQKYGGDVMLDYSENVFTLSVNLQKNGKNLLNIAETL